MPKKTTTRQKARRSLQGRKTGKPRAPQDKQRPGAEPRLRAGLR